MTCDRTGQLHAYHDGELSAADAAAFEEHLDSCDSCMAELESLRQTSAMFASAPKTRLSQITRHRLHAQVEAAMERGLVRLTWAMSGIAAAILLVGSVWLAQHREPARMATATAAAPPWVQAVTYANTNVAVTESPAAQYYLADATTRSEESP